MLKLNDISFPFRYRLPSSGKIVGVHEAAKLAGESLTAEGKVVEGALLTAEFHAAIATRDGIGDVIQRLGDVMKSDSVENRKLASEVLSALEVLANNSAASSARLQVYMQAFAPEFSPVHPENAQD